MLIDNNLCDRFEPVKINQTRNADFSLILNLRCEQVYSGSRMEAIHNRAQHCCAPTNGLYSMQLRTAII